LIDARGTVFWFGLPLAVDDRVDVIGSPTATSQKMAPSR
jgi:hypothetical protein